MRSAPPPQLPLSAGSILGLTGAIAAGKSTVARRLVTLGASVIDADQIAREIVAPGQPGLDELVAEWGPSILDEQGALDRRQLGSIIFQRPEARARLEAITHPKIAALSADRIAEAQRSGAELIFYEAALLIEAGRAEQFRPLIVVGCAPAVQRERLLQRDGLSPEEVERRIAAQLDPEEKRRRADFFIENSGDRDTLFVAVDALWAQLTRGSSRSGLSTPTG